MRRTDPEIKEGFSRRFAADRADPSVRAIVSFEHYEEKLVRRKPNDLQDTWCPRRDSNPEPTDYESAALTVELQGHTTRPVPALRCR